MGNLFKVRGLLPALLVLGGIGWQLWTNGGSWAVPRFYKDIRAEIHQKMQPNIDGSHLCQRFTPDGKLPQVPPGSMLVADDLFCWSLNPETKLADWVIYRLDRKTVDPDCPLEQTRNWCRDEHLDPVLVLEPEDYYGAHAALKTDRGHLAPLRSFCGHPLWRETNQITNIAPQRSTLNRGVWKDLEVHVRDVAIEHGPVWVVTGTAYLREMPKLPGADEEHQIPSHFWKVVRTGDDVLGAWIFDQDDDARSFGDGAIGVEELEGAIGLKL